MSRGAYLLGAPGVGKSTVMVALREHLEVDVVPEEWYRARGELHVEPLVDLLDRPQGFSIGRTREAFSGTDALSMSVARDARAWAADPDEEPPALVLGEGARLAEVTFLAGLSLKLDRLAVVYLQAEDATLAKRREGRTQSAQFVKAASTRAGNAANRLKDAGLLTAVIQADRLTPERIAEVVAEEMNRN